MKSKGLCGKLLSLTLGVAFALPLRAQEVPSFPPKPSASIAASTMQESIYSPLPAVSHLVKDSPNIVIVFIDDVGPAQADTFGGAIHTPTISRFAQRGSSAPLIFTGNDCLDFGSPVGLEYYDQAPFKFNGTIKQAQWNSPSKDRAVFNCRLSLRESVFLVLFRGAKDDTYFPFGSNPDSFFLTREFGSKITTKSGTNNETLKVAT